MKKSLFLLAFLPVGVFAQELFPDFLAPSFRGSPGAEFSQWEFFTSAFADPNSPDVAAAASAPTLTQTLTSTAFLTSGFNIYSFSAATGFDLDNDTSATVGDLGTVVFQFETLGTFIDYDTIQLNYSGGSVAPEAIISESRVITGGFGGFTNRAAVQWDLTGLAINDYTITFQALGSSSSFNTAVLDVSTSHTGVVPVAGTFDGSGGTTNWSDTGNWVSGAAPDPAANVHVTGGSGVVLDGDREVGQLTFSQSGTLAVTGASTLTVNTGIELADGAGDTTIATALHGGGHLFLTVADNATLEILGDVSGEGAVGPYPAVGLTKEGSGTAVIEGDVTFEGGVAVADGTLRLSGDNTYAGATTVTAGRLEVAGDAPSGAAGALGNATSTVTVGADPATFGPLPAAELIIAGNFTVSRNVSLVTGTNTKVLGGANTTTEAVFAGNVSLASSTSNVILRAENANDVVRFAGQITGSGTPVIVKDGLGTVVFSGSNKTYANATTISAGTLLLASGTVTGNGNWTVSSGAALEVDGTLAGSGSLALDGTLSGSGLVNRTVTTGGIASMIEAGNSPGTLTVASLNATSGVSFAFELGNSSDLVQISGGFVGGGFDDSLQFQFFDSGGLQAGVAYTLLTYGSASGLDESDFLVVTNGFVVDTWNIGGNSLSVTFSAIPEPGSLALIALALGGLGMVRRRRSAP